MQHFKASIGADQFVHQVQIKFFELQQITTALNFSPVIIMIINAIYIKEFILLSLLQT